MVDIVFDTGGTGNSVTVTGHVVYDSFFGDERYGQHSLRTGDGALVTYDNAGINVVEGEIVIKNVTYENGEQLRTWIRRKAVYKLNAFSITVPTGVDLGEGKGINLAGVNFNDDTDKKVFKYEAPGLYTIKFPYTYVRESGIIGGYSNIIFTATANLVAA